MGKRKNKSGKRKGKKKNKMSKSSRSELQRLKYIQAIEELEAEIVQLQINNEKLNGDGVDGLSYTELESLASLLKQGLRSVVDQQEKAHDEYSHSQIADSEVMGTEWVLKNEEEDFAHQSLLSKRRRTLRLKARELRLRSSLHDIPKEPMQGNDHELWIQIFKSEKKRLVLWNQKMIGKELGRMSYVELMKLELEIDRALLSVQKEMRSIKQAEMETMKESAPPMDPVEVEKPKEDEEEQKSGLIVPNEGNGLDFDKYSWTQNFRKVTITIPVPSGTKSQSLACEVKKNRLKVGLKGQDPIIDGEFFNAVMPYDCFWAIHDQKSIYVLLRKDQTEWWKYCVKGEPEIDTQKVGRQTTANRVISTQNE